MAKQSIARRYPAMPLDFLAWRFPSDPARCHGGSPRPKLRIAWCSRCLAAGFAKGEPAYIRQQWILAASGFCHEHRWPLEDRCNSCRSPDWGFVTSARGPLRMICTACWQPLERASVSTLDAEKKARVCWDHVIGFEQPLMGAMAGKTPDQFRFNFTSASQLLDQVRDICSLLTRAPRGHDDWAGKTRAIALNDFLCDAMAPSTGGDPFLSYDAPNPLTTATPLLRRSLLAAAYAIIDADPGTSTALFGPDASPAIDIFVSGMNRALLDSYPPKRDAGPPHSLSTLRLQSSEKCRGRPSFAIKSASPQA